MPIWRTLFSGSEDFEVALMLGVVHGIVLAGHRSEKNPSLFFLKLKVENT